jgi:hypothetical protein
MIADWPGRTFSTSTGCTRASTTRVSWPGTICMMVRPDPMTPPTVVTAMATTIPSTGARMSRRRTTSSLAISFSFISCSWFCTSCSDFATSSRKERVSWRIWSSASPMACWARASEERSSPRSPSSRATSRSSARTRLRVACPLSASSRTPRSSWLMSPTWRSRESCCALRPVICSWNWEMRWRRIWVWPSSAALRAAKTSLWLRIRSRMPGSSARARSTSGKTTAAAPSCSARRRAWSARVASIWPCTMAREACGRTGSRRISTSPAVTLSPSRTRISLMMPPSRCWTSRRLVSTTTVPPATTALSSGASAAHTPAPPKATRMVRTPAKMAARALVEGGGIGAASWSASASRSCSRRLAAVLGALGAAGVEATFVSIFDVLRVRPRRPGRSKGRARGRRRERGSSRSRPSAG